MQKNVKIIFVCSNFLLFELFCLFEIIFVCSNFLSVRTFCLFVTTILSVRNYFCLFELFATNYSTKKFGPTKIIKRGNDFLSDNFCMQKLIFQTESMSQCQIKTET